MQKIQNAGSYFPEAQGSRKHEGEWPYKLGSQYKARHTTVVTFKTMGRYNGTTKMYVALGSIMEPLSFVYHHHHHTITIHYSSDFDKNSVLVMSRKMHCINTENWCSTSCTLLKGVNEFLQFLLILSTFIARFG